MGLKQLTARISRVATRSVTPMDGYFLWDLRENPSSKQTEAKLKRLDPSPEKLKEFELIRELYFSGIEGKTLPLIENSHKLSFEGRLLLLSMFGRAGSEGRIPDSEVGREFFREAAHALGFDQVSAEEPMSFRDPQSGDQFVAISSAILETHQKDQREAQKLAWEMIDRQERHSVLSIASPNTPGWLDLAIWDSSVDRPVPQVSLIREKDARGLSTLYQMSGPSREESAWMLKSKQGLVGMAIIEPTSPQKRIEDYLNSTDGPPVPRNPDGTVDRTRFEAGLRNSPMGKQLLAYGDDVRTSLEKSYHAWLSPDPNGFVPDFMERVNPDPEVTANLPAQRPSSGQPEGAVQGTFTHIASGDPLHRKSDVSACYGQAGDSGSLPLRYCYQRQADALAGRQMLRVEYGGNQEDTQFLISGGVKFVEKNGQGFRIGNPSLGSATVNGLLTQDFYFPQLGGNVTTFTVVTLDMPAATPGNIVGSVNMGGKRCWTSSDCMQLTMSITQPDPGNTPLNGIQVRERRVFLMYTNPW